MVVEMAYFKVMTPEFAWGEADKNTKPRSGYLLFWLKYAYNS